MSESPWELRLGPAAAARRDTLLGRLDQAESFFRQAYDDWPTLTPAEKDEKMRQACRGLSGLISVVRTLDLEPL